LSIRVVISGRNPANQAQRETLAFFSQHRVRKRSRNRPCQTCWHLCILLPPVHVTVPADPCLRKRVIIFVSILWPMGLASLYFFQGVLREIEALATTSPLLAFEKLNLVRTAVRNVTLVSAMALVCLLGYVSFCVHRTGQWPPLGWRVM
jgi:hypothetical protein